MSSQAKIPIAYYTQPDKRRLDTQAKLFAALKTMYAASTPIADISVTALCRAAGISRQAFYRHYHQIDEVIVNNTILVANQFLLNVDQTLDANRKAATIMVDLILGNRTSFAMIFWGHVEEQVIQLITSDMRRVNNFQTKTSPTEAIRLELFARAIISFAQVMIHHPEIDRGQLIELYKQTVPAPQTIFETKS